MPKFRKKPIVIEAFQWKDNPAELPFWITKHENFITETDGDGNFTGCIIETLEGDMRVNLDDWIIKGVEGEIYPCKPSVFAATYEPAE